MFEHNKSSKKDVIGPLSEAKKIIITNFLRKVYSRLKFLFVFIHIVKLIVLNAGNHILYLTAVFRLSLSLIFVIFIK